jgi:RES domain-containing protein
MKVFRLAKERAGRYRADDLSGAGAALAGGRWNPRGMAVLYTSCYASTALLEARVHTQGMLPSANLFLVTLELPDEDWIGAMVPAMPDDWNVLDHDPMSTVSLGRAWLEQGATLALKVPSVVCPTDFNLLLNPRHVNMRDVAVVDKQLFNVDRRLFN